MAFSACVTVCRHWADPGHCHQASAAKAPKSRFACRWTEFRSQPTEVNRAQSQPGHWRTPCAARASGGSRSRGGVGNFAQDFRNALKLACLVQEVANTKCARRTLILWQRVVGEHNRHGLGWLICQGTQDSKARALPQMQIEDHDVDRLRMRDGDRGAFVVDSADKNDARNVVQQFTQAIREDG